MYICMSEIILIHIAAPSKEAVYILNKTQLNIVYNVHMYIEPTRTYMPLTTMFQRWINMI